MENSKLVYKNGKQLRTGYTTGSCAAAAAKGAVIMLLSGEAIQEVEIDTPKGWPLTLELKHISWEEDGVRCCVVKDAGDDPDVTDKIEVYAKAKKTAAQGITLSTGLGVGKVTKAGLLIPPGMPAINPVPRSMIMKEVGEVLPEDQGVEVEISIPQGVEIAKRTFNPRLGIEGGISVLGTTGIVEPMSEDALKDTVALELSCRKAAGQDKVLLVPGSYGERFCQEHFSIPKEKAVKMSNYLGFALEKCDEYGFKKVIIAGHLGKLVKPAGGIFYTHSRISDTRMEILTANLALLDMPNVHLKEIMACITTEEAIPIIDKLGYQEIYSVIAEKCAQRCEGYVYGHVEIGVILFSMKRMLAKSSKADRILEEIRHE
ncbi:cobalt-precorrin-5B (C(1))-methyltransferase CbiD [Dehalobacterium formicoaceticum]|uniref:Cobalt-precorrin-5B C(1)-methyltransferase n=1 Tax=Dehalobacterium formicoaceticum TaxID=51515 RepID=A0ABT1Y1N5_9FIRM|nr:cobalt-precorrin-5B (C(1))-methyltransferase CbiD [Dehalobacterium formicoaceticum]MCR6544773.1 cobalt-precorrin-5B (C(1))-methyltransferase CbiD [Dehalobacterium formicoaceticum]